jgi:hypothetical protein
MCNFKFTSYQGGAISQQMLSQTQRYNSGVAGLHDLDLNLKLYTKVNGKSLMD